MGNNVLPAIAKRIFCSLLLLFLVAVISPGQDASRRQSFAILNVTVIDVNGAPPKLHMTVVINGNRIAAIGKTSQIRLPKKITAIDGTGRFLIPGLWDMHVHLGTESFDRDGYLSLLIANGVTGIRIMDGRPEHHVWRAEIDSGNLLGPRMEIASRIIDGPKSYLSGVVRVSTAAEARAAAQKAKREGADFLKVHDAVPREAYFALIAEAKRLGLSVAGHVPAAITALEASSVGQRSIEHLSGLEDAKSDDKKAVVLFATFKRNHTWNCPTLIMRHNYALLRDPRLANDPRLKFAKPSWRSRWLKLTNEANSWSNDEEPNRLALIRKEDALVGKMQQAGLGLLAGTDDGNPYVIPGFSLHDELVLLVGSGLSPMQALQAATLRPAKFLNRLNALGTLRKGKLADLVLLDANPLDDIRNTTKINAVIANGRYLNRARLDGILHRVETAANNGPK